MGFLAIRALPFGVHIGAPLLGKLEVFLRQDSAGARGAADVRRAASLQALRGLAGMLGPIHRGFNLYCLLKLAALKLLFRFGIYMWFVLEVEGSFL